MINGLLVVNKKENYTSRDVVNKVGKILKTKKIGHTGTLDPIASGVLVLTIGKATKLSEIITSEEKEYIATAVLGLDTDTLDITGNILKNEDVIVSREDIVNALNKFKKTYNQEVPLYSAVKINGMKLYDYARKNIDVVLPKRKVTIKEIKLLDYYIKDNKTHFTFSCLVSKGTYIRSLIKDISNSLNTFGVMEKLIRTKQGDFDISNSYSLEDISNNNYKIISLSDALSNYYTVKVDEKLKFKIDNGAILDDIYNKDFVLFVDEDVLALYKKENNKLKPFKMFK